MTATRSGMAETLPAPPAPNAVTTARPYAPGVGDAALGGAAVLVPVKAFGAAKGRLAPALDAGSRAALAERMATRVLAAAAPLPAVVVCDDEGVAAWARACGASVVWS